MNGYYSFEKGFYGLSDIPTIFEEKIDRSLNYRTPVWLDDIIIVKRGDKKNHRDKLFTKLEQLQEADIEQVKRNPQFFSKKQLAWSTK